MQFALSTKGNFSTKKILSPTPPLMTDFNRNPPLRANKKLMTKNVEFENGQTTINYLKTNRYLKTLPFTLSQQNTSYK